MSRILIVEDQAHIARVVALGLSREGYDIDIAMDGAQGLEKLRAGGIDILITDVEMPRMDGRQLCQSMHDSLAGPKPATFVMTAKTDASIRSWIDALPNTELLEKPVSLRILKSKLANIIKNAGADA